jgi:hypothetical protein
MHHGDRILPSANKSHVRLQIISITESPADVQSLSGNPDFVEIVDRYLCIRGFVS